MHSLTQPLFIVSGALEQFLAELAAAGDVLARLAALQHLLELAQQESVPSVLRAEIAPHVLQLVEASDEPPMQHAAIAAVAALLRGGEDGDLVAQAVQRLTRVLQVCGPVLRMHASPAGLEIPQRHGSLSPAVACSQTPA